MELSHPVFIIPSQLGKHASPLHKISVEVGLAGLGWTYLGISQKKKKHGSGNYVKKGTICVKS